MVTWEEVKRDWAQQWEIVVQRKVHVDVDKLVLHLSFSLRMNFHLLLKETRYLPKLECGYIIFNFQVIDTVIS